MHTPRAPHRRRPTTTSVLALALGSLALGATGCATSGVNRGDFNVVSLDEEWQMGRQFEAEIGRQVRLSNDAALNAYVSELGRKIVAQTELANRTWKFRVVQSDEVNAFNVPGGLVYVNTGLIKAAANASELAGVIAHEVHHGVSRHGTERLSKQYGLSAAAGLVLGRDPGLVQQVAAQIVAGGAIARFSRSDESESDRYGVRYMARAGYNPNGMATMFEKLLAQRRSRPSSVEQFFSTHPLAEDRIQNVRAEIRRQGLSGGATTDAGFARAKARV